MFQTRTIQAQQKGMLAEITEYVKDTAGDCRREHASCGCGDFVYLIL